VSFLWDLVFYYHCPIHHSYLHRVPSLTQMKIKDSFIIVSLLIEIATITVLVHVDGMDEGVEVIVILAAVVAMLTLLVSLIVLCAGSSPARLIERDLRTCTREMLA